MWLFAAMIVTGGTLSFEDTSKSACAGLSPWLELDLYILTSCVIVSALITTINTTKSQFVFLWINTTIFSAKGHADKQLRTNVATPAIF